MQVKDIMTARAGLLRAGHTTPQGRPTDGGA